MYFHIHIASADPRLPKRPCCCLLGIWWRQQCFAVLHSFGGPRPPCCLYPPVSSHGFCSNIQHRVCPTVIELVQNMHTRQVSYCGSAALWSGLLSTTPGCFVFLFFHDDLGLQRKIGLLCSLITKHREVGSFVQEAHSTALK